MLRSLTFDGVEIRPQLVPRNSSYALNVEHTLGGDARPLLNGLDRDAELAGEFGLTASGSDRLINWRLLTHAKDDAGFSCVLQVIPAMRTRHLQARLVALESIHKRIRRLREARKMTQEQLAKAAGVAYQSVQEWEREGGTAPSRKRLPKVAEALHVSVSALLYGDSSTPHRVEQVPAPYDTAQNAREEILLHLYRGLFGLQQAKLIQGLRALFEANQITRKELGQKPLRGVSDEAVERAFGKVPPIKKRAKGKASRDIGDAMGDFLDDS